MKKSYILFFALIAVFSTVYFANSAQVRFWGFQPDDIAATVTLTGAKTFSATTTINGTLTISGTSTAVTIGGSSLSAGACTSTATVFNTAFSTSSAQVIVSPQIFPGAAVQWAGYITATAAGSSTATVEVCESVLGTPTASKYNISVIVNNNN